MVFIIFALVLGAVSFAILNRSLSAVYVAGVYLGCMASIFACLMVLAKTMGFPAAIEGLLFVNKRLKQYIASYPISFNDLTVLLVLTRVIFFMFFCLLILKINPFLAKPVKFLYAGFCGFIILLNIIMLGPNSRILFYRFVSENTARDVFYPLLQISMILFAAASELALVQRYQGLYIPWMKKRFRFFMVIAANLSVLFILFGVFGPLQVSDLAGFRYMLLRLLYSSAGPSEIYGYIIVCITIFCITAGTYTIFLYFKSLGEIGYANFSIEKSLRKGNINAKIFSHGIKNQLLVQRVLIREAMEFFSRGRMSELENKLQELSRNNDETFDRITDLYKVFAGKKIILKPESLSAVIRLSLSGLKKEAAAVPITVREFEDKKILADKICLSEAVRNIINNAIDAVLLKGNNETGNVTINCYRNGFYNIIEIADNGMGIEAKKLKKIFEPFYSEKNTTYSWGLGLSYAERIIRKHFGMIRVESKYRERTVFYVFIPLFEE
jgi:signal transduction histidine kinase